VPYYQLKFQRGVLIIMYVDSAIQTHLQENPTHAFDPENIEILDKAATSNFKIRLKEELQIITDKPELNSQHAAAYKRKHDKTQ
jgi:hypothetical protein